MHDDDDPIEESSDNEGESDEEREPRGLPPEERESVEADLEDLGAMQGVFESQGARGVVIACTECGSNHYYDWELLRESLQHMLETGEPRMHEPAYQPREDDYVVWDYGKGYVDALADAGLDGGPAVELTACPWCRAPIESHFTFCPACGRSLGAARLLGELTQRGMGGQEVRAL